MPMMIKIMRYMSILGVLFIPLFVYASAIYTYNNNDRLVFEVPDDQFYQYYDRETGDYVNSGSGIMDIDTITLEGKELLFMQTPIDCPTYSFTLGECFNISNQSFIAYADINSKWVYPYGSTNEMLAGIITYIDDTTGYIMPGLATLLILLIALFYLYDKAKTAIK
jgi:hypothetical protein